MRLSPVLCGNPDLPALAWMVEITSQRIVFEHGTGVEADEGWSLYLARYATLVARSDLSAPDRPQSA